MRFPTQHFSPLFCPANLIPGFLCCLSDAQWNELERRQSSLQAVRPFLVFVARTRRCLMRSIAWRVVRALFLIHFVFWLSNAAFERGRTEADAKGRRADAARRARQIVERLVGRRAQRCREATIATRGQSPFESVCSRACMRVHTCDAARSGNEKERERLIGRRSRRRCVMRSS